MKVKQNQNLSEEVDDVNTDEGTIMEENIGEEIEPKGCLQDDNRYNQIRKASCTEVDYLRKQLEYQKNRAEKAESVVVNMGLANKLSFNSNNQTQVY